LLDTNILSSYLVLGYSLYLFPNQYNVPSSLESNISNFIVISNISKLVGKVTYHDITRTSFSYQVGVVSRFTQNPTFFTGML